MEDILAKELSTKVRSVKGKSRKEGTLRGRKQYGGLPPQFCRGKRGREAEPDGAWNLHCGLGQWDHEWAGMQILPTPKDGRMRGRRKKCPTLISFCLLVSGWCPID